MSSRVIVESKIHIVPGRTGTVVAIYRFIFNRAVCFLFAELCTLAFNNISNVR